MNRKGEIFLILRDLFRRVKDAIRYKEHSSDMKDVLNTADEILKLTKMIEQYNREYKSLH